MTAKKEVAKAGGVPAEVKTEDQVPDHIRARMNEGSGLKADVSDLIVPRIKLLHGTSKEPETFNTAKAGIYWLNTLDIPLGERFRFIPVSNRKRVLLMRPMEDKTGEPILARADDGKTWDRTGEWQVKLKGRRTPDVTWKIDTLSVEGSGLLRFGTSDPQDDDSNPAATVFHEYLVYLPDFVRGTPVMLSLARTAAKPARELNSKIELRGGPMQGMLFEASVIKETNDAGQDFFNVQFQSAGWASVDEMAKAEAWAERFQSYRGAEEEELANETGGGKKAAPKERGEV